MAATSLPCTTADASSGRPAIKVDGERYAGHARTAAAIRRPKSPDFNVGKGFKIPKWEGSSFAVGARLFNLFNHPNFNFPNGSIDSPGFGQITRLVSQPTTILGSGLGADASPRL